MTIKKRSNGPPVYHEYRIYMWNKIDRTNFSYHGACFVTPDGDVKLGPTQVILQPKPNLFLKDIWHCGSLPMAKMTAQDILRHEDVTYIQLKGLWIWVEWNHHGKLHQLPGQPAEDRTKYRGR